jgi:nitrile hydratase
MSRHARETLPPAQYLGSTYYEIWLEGLKKLLVNARLATAEETADGRMRVQSAQGLPRLAAEQVAQRLAKGSPTRREVASHPRFGIGDAVVTRQMNPQGHTRLPRYCRGKRGTIDRMHGAHVFPDTHAAGQGEQPQWLYTVRFEARELWGPDTTASNVYVDCWEPYLEAAP